MAEVINPAEVLAMKFLLSNLVAEIALLNERIGVAPADDWTASLKSKSLQDIRCTNVVGGHSLDQARVVSRAVLITTGLFARVHMLIANEVQLKAANS